MLTLLLTKTWRILINFFVWLFGSYKRLITIVAFVFAILFYNQRNKAKEYKELADLSKQQVEDIQHLILKMRDTSKFQKTAIERLQGDTLILNKKSKDLLDSLIVSEQNVQFWKNRIGGIQEVVRELTEANRRLQEENRKIKKNNR